MGTRRLTVFCDEDGHEIAVLYRQFDGYPTGHGEELKIVFSGFSICNGYDEKLPRQANGMSCLAAQIIAYFKDGVGNFYLYPAGTRDCGEEYIYTVGCKDARIWLTIEAGCVTYFGLPGTKQKNMARLFDGFIEEFDPEATEERRKNLPEEPPNDFLNTHASDP